MKLYLKVLLIVLINLIMVELFSDSAWAVTYNKALSIPIVGMGNDQALGTLEIMEGQVGGLVAGDENTNTILLTMPEGITFSYINVFYIGGWSEGDWQMAEQPTTNSSGYSTWTLWLANPSESQIGVIRIDMAVNIDPSTQKGDISCTISGTNPYITPGSVIVGRYGKYGVTGTCIGPTTIFAGRCDAKIGSPVMQENLPGTLLKDRTVYLELPERCRWVSIPKANTTSSVVLSEGSYVDDSAYRIVSYKVEQTSSFTAGVIEFKQGTVSVPLDFPAGDLKVSFGGNGGALDEDASTVSTKVATVVTPITLTGTNPTQIVITGTQAQKVGNFSVVEASPGAITDYIGNGSNLVIKAPAGVYFTNIPGISVGGDLKLDFVKTHLSDGGRCITIPVINPSVRRVGTIAFSNVNLTLDGAVPEGPIEIAVTGSALDWWPAWYSNWTVARQNFDYANAAQGQIANVGVPTPVNPATKPTVFTIDSTSYKLFGVDKTMDCAPYLKDDRTFLPVLYVGYVMGINDDDIFWDEANQTVTLIKDNKVIQLTIGNTTMLINGLPVALDVAPEVIPPGRTCLPIALLKYVIEGDISWDSSAQKVTIISKSLP